MGRARGTHKCRYIHGSVGRPDRRRPIRGAIRKWDDNTKN